MSGSQSSLRRILLKEEYVLLLGDLVDALVLRQMEFWQKHVASFEAYYREELLRRDRLGSGPKNYGWVYKKSRQLAEEDFRKAISEDRVRRSLRRLVERGILDERRNPNPAHRYDKTLQYRLDLWQLREQLQGSEAVRQVGYELPNWAETYQSHAPVPQFAASSPQPAGSSTQAAAAIPEKNKEEKYDNPSGSNLDVSVGTLQNVPGHTKPVGPSRGGSPFVQASNRQLLIPPDLNAWLDENVSSPEKKSWLLKTIQKQYTAKYGPETAIGWLQMLKEQLENGDTEVEKFEAYILGALRNMQREGTTPLAARVQPRPGREEVIPRRLALRLGCQGDQPVYETAEYEDGLIEFYEVGRAEIHRINTQSDDKARIDIANIRITRGERRNRELTLDLREEMYDWGGKRQPRISEAQKVGVFLMEEYRSSSWRKYRWPIDEQGLPLPAAWPRQPTGTRFSRIEQGILGEEVTHWQWGKDGEFIRIILDQPIPDIAESPASEAGAPKSEDNQQDSGLPADKLP